MGVAGARLILWVMEEDRRALRGVVSRRRFRESSDMMKCGDLKSPDNSRASRLAIAAAGNVCRN